MFFAADKRSVVWQSLGALRCEIARRHGLIDHNKYNLFWVTEFPLFEYSEEEGRYVAAHHPFTSWYPEDNCYLDTDKEKVRSQRVRPGHERHRDWHPAPSVSTAPICRRRCSR